MSNGEFEGLRALVTGGASGIGAATAEELRRRKAVVTTIDLNTDPNDKHALSGSVTDPEGIVLVVDEAAKRMGGLDIVVNNAGIGAVGTIETATEAEWVNVFDVNVFGIARVSAAALPYLRKSDHPSIVNVCSIAATAGLPQRAVYSASKGAVLSLTQAMAADLCAEGIRVNCVNPGTVATPWVERLLDAAPDPVAERSALERRQPLGRLGTASEVAYAIATLASPLSGWTTGASFATDGGMAGLRTVG